MKPRSLLAAGLALAVAAGVARPHGITERLDTIETAAEVVLDSHAGDAKGTASITKVLKALRSPRNARSLADELRGVQKAVRLTETRLPDEALFLGVFDDERLGYIGDLNEARARLELAVTAPRLAVSKRRSFQRRAKQFDRLIFGVNTAKLTTPLTVFYGNLAKGAALTAGFTRYDDASVFRWAVTSIALAPAGEGVDLTGDRKPDNAARRIQNALDLFGAGVDLDQILRDAVASSGEAALIESWAVGSFQRDPVAFTGLFAGTQDDVVYVANGATLAADGHAVARGFTPFAKGRYSVELTGDVLAVGGLVLPAGARLVVEGTASAAANDGFVGIAIPVAGIEQILADAEIELPDLVDLSVFADVDTDGDGTEDAISVSLAFSAVAAAIVSGS